MRNQLRNRLLLAFLAATLVPLSLSIWLISSLLDRSLELASTSEIDELSKALEVTGREFYQQARDRLREDAESGRLEPASYPIVGREEWPPEVGAFWDSGEPERFVLAGEAGSALHYLSRGDDGVLQYARSLGAVRMDNLSELYGRARTRVESTADRDLRRGFQYTLLLVATSVSAVTIALMVFFAHRISRPVQRLTTALRRLAAGEADARVEARGQDEISEALAAFNHMADQLQQSRDRLVLLTQLSSWQALGRKMAHEVKNSLTPIRLTVEEMAARHASHLPPQDREFLDQAAQIITDEVNRLERRVAAFSDLAADPPIHFAALDVNATVEERIEFHRAAHPGVSYDLQLSPQPPLAWADEDLVRGILTNLIENAAEAVGTGGVVLAVTSSADGNVRIEIHDSGPGLSEHARETLFQPTISFKKSGMGLGLSIAHKSAMLTGGDIASISGELGGAGFRVTLKEADPAKTAAEFPKEERTWAPSES